MLNLKRKQKKLKEPVPSGKKKSTKLETLSDLERALSESKDTASAVGALAFLSNWSLVSLCLCLSRRSVIFSSSLLALLFCRRTSRTALFCVSFRLRKIAFSGRKVYCLCVQSSLTVCPQSTGK